MTSIKGPIALQPQGDRIRGRSPQMFRKPFRRPSLIEPVGEATPGAEPGPFLLAGATVGEGVAR
jgi:hypothetical protein